MKNLLSLIAASFVLFSCANPEIVSDRLVNAVQNEQSAYTQFKNVIGEAHPADRGYNALADWFDALNELDAAFAQVDRKELKKRYQNNEDYQEELRQAKGVLDSFFEARDREDGSRDNKLTINYLNVAEWNLAATNDVFSDIQRRFSSIKAVYLDIFGSVFSYDIQLNTAIDDKLANNLEACIEDLTVFGANINPIPDPACAAYAPSFCHPQTDLTCLQDRINSARTCSEYVPAETYYDDCVDEKGNPTYDSEGNIAQCEYYEPAYFIEDELKSWFVNLPLYKESGCVSQTALLKE